MSKYRKILIGYINSRDDDSQYLSITNVSDDDVVIKAGEKVYLNKTPKDILQKYPKIPHFDKSIKEE
jgi:hypothetical protein